MNDARELEPREALVWFVFKIWASILLASMTSSPFLLSLSGWLALFGAATAGLAFTQRERFKLGTCRRWDQALWLTGASAVMLLAHSLIAT